LHLNATCFLLLEKQFHFKRNNKKQQVSVPCNLMSRW